MAAHRMGARAVLVTHRFDRLGEMSCNPAIGGLGKGHIVREIDAMDGVMGQAADAAGIQFRLLNASKGPAAQGPRVQADRCRYRAAIQEAFRARPEVRVVEGEVVDLIVEHGAVAGVRLADGTSLRAGAVVLTTGTFLRGVIHMGEETRPAGRLGDRGVGQAGGADRRARPAPRAAEDRDAAEARRPDHRLERRGRPAGGRRPGDALVPFARAGLPAALLRRDRDEPAHPRHHPRQPRPVGDVRRADRGRRPALLPLDRGQGGALRGQGVAPGLPRAGGPGHADRLPERDLDLPAARRAGGLCPFDPRA